MSIIINIRRISVSRLGRNTNDVKDPFKQKIHSVGERVVAFVLVGRGGLAGGLGAVFGGSRLDLPGARSSLIVTATPTATSD